ncbi:MAG: MFS transporter [Pirellulaceae bacterium]|nr:MFS transporter [Pirellulaceae bacterium]
MSNPHKSPATESSQVSPLTRGGVITWLCAAAMIAYICRNSLGVAESTIRGELRLSEETMGYVMGLFFLTYALGQIPTGALGTRWGSRKSIPLCAAGLSLATAAMSMATGAGLLVAARLANGLFQAGLFPCCTNTISAWFSSKLRAVPTGCLGASMSLGGAIGVFMTGFLVVSIGWRATFASYSLLGIAWAIGFYWWFRDTPAEFLAERIGAAKETQEEALQRESTGATANTGASAVAEATPWLPIYSSPATWWICGQQFCRAAGQIFFGSWFATYLQDARDVSVATSGVLNSLPLIALVVGALAGGAISDGLLAMTGSRTIARKWLATVCMSLCALLVFGAYFVQQPVVAVLIISGGSFCAAVGGPCAYTITIDMGGRHVGALFGTMNMVGNLGALAFITGVGRFTKQGGNWDSVLLLFGGLYVAAGLFWLLLRPEGDIFEQSLISSDNNASPDPAARP